MSIPFIGREEIEDQLRWAKVADAIFEGHKRSKARLGDLFLNREEDQSTMLNRAAWIDDLGLAMKAVTVYPKNAQRDPAIPTIHGVVILFDDDSGQVKALVDGQLVTKWKTATDSVLGARLLARKESKKLLVVGSGVVAESLVDAYREIFPDLERIQIWSRTHANAQELAAQKQCEAVEDLAEAVADADIVTSATMAREPFIKGEWASAGTHFDLIGAFKDGMREADDALLQKAKLFVDSRETTIDHIGELKDPIARGVISTDDVLADYYDMVQPDCVMRTSEDDITLFKNGGGAHLDLMVANAIYEIWSSK
jgi:ornithine cyclodeaminase